MTHFDSQALKCYMHPISFVLHQLPLNFVAFFLLSLAPAPFAHVGLSCKSIKVGLEIRASQLGGRGMHFPTPDYREREGCKKIALDTRGLSE